MLAFLTHNIDKLSSSWIKTVTQIFRRKSAKVAEIGDYSIDPM
jgi:hypothetical protein